MATNGYFLRDIQCICHCEPVSRFIKFLFCVVQSDPCIDSQNYPWVNHTKESLSWLGIDNVESLEENIHDLNYKMKLEGLPTFHSNTIGVMMFLLQTDWEND